MNTLIYSVTDCSQCSLIVKYVFINSNLSPIKKTVKLEYDRDGNYQYNITRAIARILKSWNTMIFRVINQTLKLLYYNKTSHCIGKCITS